MCTCTFLYMLDTGDRDLDELDTDKWDTGELDMDELDVCMLTMYVYMYLLVHAGQR